MEVKVQRVHMLFSDLGVLLGATITGWTGWTLYMVCFSSGFFQKSVRKGEKQANFPSPFQIQIIVHR